MSWSALHPWLATSFNTPRERSSPQQGVEPRCPIHKPTVLLQTISRIEDYILEPLTAKLPRNIRTSKRYLDTIDVWSFYTNFPPKYDKNFYNVVINKQNDESVNT